MKAQEVPVHESPAQAGPWDAAALAELREFDPVWAEQCFTMSANPWTSGILPRKTVELVALAWCSACTNLNAEGTRRHIRGALDAGATRDEILWVLKAAAALAIHTCSLGAPILLEEAQAAGVKAAAKTAVTPACDQMRAIGQWNQAWDPFYQLDPKWTDEFFALAIGMYTKAPLPAKEIELLSIAFDASITHMYALGTRRHIKAALAHGATMEEVMEVLKVCVALGVQACNQSMPILAEELEHDRAN
jgi:alkylhydroperoxidase/carboxymuconolactone decarboxylase family protein YurZ